MEVRLFSDPGAFAELASGFMDADPFTTNVIGVALTGRRNQIEMPSSGDVWVAVVDEGTVVGIGMCTPPHNPFLARMSVEAATAVAHSFLDAGYEFHGVNGESVAAGAFAEAWRERTGVVPSVQIAMRFYRLVTLKAPSDVSGAARTAGPEDAGLVLTWSTDFQAEANPNEPLNPLLDLMERRLAAGLITLWTDNGKAVAIAGRTLAANGVARVSLVYTEPESRRRGYGAAVTASASQRAIDDGAAHVALYADQTNETSNGVYQSIGYVADHDSEHRVFVS